MIVSAVVIARNEENHISNTIKSLIKQDLKLREIVLVNDGSTDRTPNIAKELGCIIVNLPYHEMSYVGRPELGQVLNHGLAEIRRNGVPDYILQMGADHVLPVDYVSSLLDLMGESVKISSGTYPNVRLEDDVPLGSGRLIDARIWDTINGIEYPVKYGYESWIVYKYRMLGYDVKRYDSIVTDTRPIRMNTKKAFEWGKCSYALGGSFIFALVKALGMGFSGLSYLKGFYSRKDVEKHQDIEEYVKQQQWKRAFGKIR